MLELCEYDRLYKYLFVPFSKISPEPGGGDNMDKDENEGAFNDEAPDPNQTSSVSLNRSSSFLFDSLYHSPLLADLSPHQIPDQSDEEESINQEMKEKCASSTQERRRSELLANQEAEKQEAIQWGESFFNLSEWGDSLLIGEHYLERQSLFRQADGTEQEHEQMNPEQNVLCEGQMQPQLTTTPQNEHDEKNQGRLKNIKQRSTQESVKPGGRQEMGIEDVENAKHVETKGEEKENKKKMDAILSHNTVFKQPFLQNAPESAFDCSPGLQEIFDRWPSMSDQPLQNTTEGLTVIQTHTAAAANTAGAPLIPESSKQAGKKREKLQQSAATSNSKEGRPLRSDSENLLERPGSAGDLIPPTQETPPVTPRVKLTTSSIQSPLNQLIPSSRFQEKLAIAKCPKTPTGNHNLRSVVSASDNKSLESTTDHHQKRGQEPQTLPNPELTTVLQSNLKTTSTSETLSPPRHSVPPSSSQPQPLSDTESPVFHESFTLQLSQDASVCSRNSGTFSIIDVASDRRLFEMFIKEWKTKQRYSLALACERTEQPEGEIGGKHKRGN